MGLVDSNTNKVKWAIDSPASLSLQGDMTFEETDGTIQSVTFGDPPLTLGLGHVQMFRKMPFKINTIQKTSENSCLLKVAPRTKASLFIMPMLGGNKDLYFHDSLFINAFIGTDKEDSCIALLYRFSGTPLFLKFEQALKKFRCYRDVVDPSPHHVMFIFNIPDNYIEDYDKFILGKFSELSPQLKEAILKFYNADLHSSLGQILFKSEKRRLRLSQNLGVKIPKHMELFDVPNLDEEVYNPKIYI
tara:strand:+ start:61 stop:798 length:738 start_codon:yes stop_codon:yes gene_type:complete